MEPGAWRVEVSPKTPAAEDLFLNVMQVTDRNTGAHWPVRPLDVGERTGCVIEGPQTTWAVLFRRDSTRSDKQVQFTVPGQKPCRVLVADLTPGRWHAQREGGADVFDLEVSENSGAIWLEGKGGDWTLRR